MGLKDYLIVYTVLALLRFSVCAESHQVLAQLLDTLLVIGTQLPESPIVRQRLIEVACKVTHTYICYIYTKANRLNRTFQQQNPSVFSLFSPSAPV